MVCLQTISTILLPLPVLNPHQLVRLESWLRSVLWDVRLPILSDDFARTHGSTSRDSSFSIHRAKGRIRLTDGTVKMIQGVREVFEIVDMDDGGAGLGEVTTPSKVVFIGKGLDQQAFERSLEMYLGS